ncbi:MAG: hypothetical protein ACYC35_15495 [Pirellulales bacterium]
MLIPRRMPGPARRGLVLSAALAVALAAAIPTARGQSSDFKSYSDFYKKQTEEYHQVYKTPREYTIDRYFYQRPTLSPYLNLCAPERVPRQYTPRYQTYVRPELERREALSNSSLSRPPVSYSAASSPVRPTAAPPTYRGGAGITGTQGSRITSGSSQSPSLSPYYNHWYGNSPTGR